MASLYGGGATAVAATNHSEAEVPGSGGGNECSSPDQVTENSVDITISHSGANLSTYERTGKGLQYNPKMAIAREFVLCTLGAFCSQREIGSPPACLDALGGTGLSGIQWKKFLGKRAHVTITDRNSLDLLETNCYRNSMFPKELGLDYTRPPGLALPHQLIDEIFVQQIAANVMMQLEAFDFIFIDAHGSCVPYLDSAFTNIRNNGLLCLVSSDLSALFAKTSHVAIRNYGAYVIKSDYMKEAAVRVVVGAAARSAAKCSKGIQVMLGVCIEPFVLVVVKVQRGPYYADMCSLKVRPLIHCQICEERVFCPDMRASVENPYNRLQCECQSDTPGDTALKIGPMWSDNIFNAKFLQRMIGVCRELKLSDRLESQLYSLLSECVCSSNPGDCSISPSLVSKQHSHPLLLASTTTSSTDAPASLSITPLSSSSSSSSSSRTVLLSSSLQQHGEQSLKRKIPCAAASGMRTDTTNTVTNNNNNDDFNASATITITMNNDNNDNSNNNNNNNNNNASDDTTTTATTVVDALTAADVAAAAAAAADTDGSVDGGPSTLKSLRIGNGNNNNNNNNNNGTATPTATTTTNATGTPSATTTTTTGGGGGVASGGGGGGGDVAGMDNAVSVTIVSTSSDPQGNLKMDFTVDRDVRSSGGGRSVCAEPPIKRICLPEPDPSPALSTPPFFYNVHKRKFKGVFLPKLSKLVHLLQTEGHRASRTTFDTNGIRTSANQKEIYSTLLKYCKKDT
ncbi:TRMT1-like protein [Argonauta hians]